ncbi:hypothetical protein [Halocynthiibacter namhaensis]|uniref:hypothetical protein n=1 Tax=Halocynthiibacter namhaensis TaxID=1290553 RepID=UPI00057913EC|nr:hypothetical protein [Halocynthiibacter namhaensis]
MSVTRDILACYRRPREVFERRMSGDEGLVLTYAIIAGLLAFVGQLPVWSRQAELLPELGNFASLVYSGFLVLVFVFPLFFYILAALIWFPLRALAGVSGLDIRLSMFWSLLAAMPLWLLLGLTQGLIGPGTETYLVFVLWFIAFLAFFTIGLRIASRNMGTA